MVVVARDPWLLERLREQVLAPMADLPPTTRKRLEDTLAAWLTSMGDRQAAARMLQVHPQTVRYRLRQLQDLFGDALVDPPSRLRLTLAVCWAP
jgi:DNA-binding PucR family transcriptional regulator